MLIFPMISAAGRGRERAAEQRRRGRRCHAREGSQESRRDAGRREGHRQVILNEIGTDLEKYFFTDFLLWLYIGKP